MDDTSSRYDSKRLIQVATVANEVSRAIGISSDGSIQRLAKAVFDGELTGDLYSAVEKWRHGGKPERVKVPISKGMDQWRSIAKQSTATFQSDKDVFTPPTTASTYHILADDLFEYSKVCSISPRVKEALRQLAVRYNPELGFESAALPALFPEVLVQTQNTATPAPVVADGMATKEAGPVEDGLLTKEIAVTFDGVNGWSADRWSKNLSASKWLHPARIALGAAGGASSLWNPLLLAQLMHSETKGENERAQIMKSFNSRFTRNPVLMPWREAFNEYFATHCATN